MVEEPWFAHTIIFNPDGKMVEQVNRNPDAIRMASFRTRREPINLDNRAPLPLSTAEKSCALSTLLPAIGCVSSAMKYSSPI